MPNRVTRTTKKKNLINLTGLDLGKLERTNQKAKKLTTIVTRELRAERGILRDDDGQAYNETSQGLDDLNAQIAAHNAVDEGVDRH